MYCLRQGRSRTISKGGLGWKTFQKSLLPADQPKEEWESESKSEEEESEHDGGEKMYGQQKRRMPVRKTRLVHDTDDSEDSEDESERAKRKRAFRAFKDAKSTNKKTSRIKGRPKDDNTDESDEGESMKVEVQKSKRQLEFVSEVHKEDTRCSSEDSLSGPCFPRKRKMKGKPNGIISDSESEEESGGEEEEGHQDEESDSGDSFIDDEDSSGEDSQGEKVNDEWADMLENLKRRGTKFDELNSQYEESAEARQLGGYDLSDDEERENKYPPRLLEDLRGAVKAASMDDGIEVPKELEDDNNKLIQRWEMYDVDESRDKEGECVCGRTGLRWLFFMRVKGLASWPFHTRIVGSECIRWFCRGNPRSVLVVFTRLLKEGCVATYKHQLDTRCLLFTLGGNILPPFLREHKEFHQSEYTLPVDVHEEEDEVDIIVKPPTRGRVKDEAGKFLVKGGKYQVWVRPAVRPCKDTKQVPTLDFVLVKVQDLKDGKVTVAKEKKGKDFIK